MLHFYLNTNYRYIFLRKLLLQLLELLHYNQQVIPAKVRLYLLFLLVLIGVVFNYNQSFNIQFVLVVLSFCWCSWILRFGAPVLPCKKSYFLSPGGHNMSPLKWLIFFGLKSPFKTKNKGAPSMTDGAEIRSWSHTVLNHFWFSFYVWFSYALHAPVSQSLIFRHLNLQKVCLINTKVDSTLTFYLN